MYDVIVVGARCAGSPLAMLLARQGHRVLLVDRATFPSDTISTHYLHQLGASKLREWGLLDRVVDTGVPDIRHLNFTYTDIEIAGFADPINGVDAVYCPRRTVLDEILVNAASEAGVDVLLDFTVTDVLFHEGRAAGVRGRARGSAEQEIRSRFVVGADGANSVVADKVGSEMYNHRPAGCFIYYSYYSGLDWGMHHRTGFGEQQFGTWPTNDGLNLLAVMRKRDRYADFRRDAEGTFHEIFDQIDPELGAELRDSGKREENFRSMLYAANFYRVSHGPGWALVGDAGYHKDPFTGWGMTDAFKYADLLAERLHEGLSGARPIDEATADYAKERDAASAGTFELTCSISELTLTPFYDSVFRATAQSPDYTRKFFGLIAGGYPGEEFFAPDNLRALYEDVGLPTAQRHLTAA